MSRAYDIMNELPAIFAGVSGLDAADVEIGWRDPELIPGEDLPRVLVYNPSTADPEAPEYGLRTVEFGFAVAVVGDIDSGEATLEIVEQMALQVNAASFTNADRGYMNPGSLVIDRERRLATVTAFVLAEWEGV